MKEETQRRIRRRRTQCVQLLARVARWHNTERPHQGLGQRTPDEVYGHRPPRTTRDITGGTLHVRFLDGDKRLPILRLRDAA